MFGAQWSQEALTEEQQALRVYSKAILVSVSEIWDQDVGQLEYTQGCWVNNLHVLTAHTLLSPQESSKARCNGYCTLDIAYPYEM